MSDHNRGDVAVALLIGLAAGAAAALLMAPAAGSDTRRRLNEAGRKFKERAGEKIDHVKEAARTSAGDVKSAVHAGREAYSKARSEHAPTNQTPRQTDRPLEPIAGS